MKLPKFIQNCKEKKDLFDYIVEYNINSKEQKVLNAYFFDKPLFSRIYDEAEYIGTDDLVSHIVERYLQYKENKKENKKNKNIEQINSDREI